LNQKTQDENPIIFHYSNHGKFIFKKNFEKKRIREIVFEMSSFQNWILKKNVCFYVKTALQ